jgi:pimeloyl-ACP methyl ester carboxylesterase
MFLRFAEKVCQIKLMLADYLRAMETLLLLHGAIGASAQLKPLANSLGTQYQVLTFDFSGHGGKAYNGGFYIQSFAEEVLAFLDEKDIQQANIFGYSMGGYVALYLAKQYPARVKSICTLATKFHWNEAIAEKEVKMLDPLKIEEKLPAFADTLRQRHAPNDWKEVLKYTGEMMLGLGRQNVLAIEDYASINIPVMILLGDRDKMVSLEETLDVYKALPAGKLGILPSTQHPIEQVNVELLSAFLRSHFN